MDTGELGAVPKPGTYGYERKLWNMAVRAAMKATGTTPDADFADFLIEHGDVQDLWPVHKRYVQQLRELVIEAQARNGPGSMPVAERLFDFLARCWRNPTPESSPGAFGFHTIAEVLDLGEQTETEVRALESARPKMETVEEARERLRADGCGAKILRQLQVNGTMLTGALVAKVSGWSKKTVETRCREMESVGLVRQPRRGQWALPA